MYIYNGLIERVFDLTERIEQHEKQVISGISADYNSDKILRYNIEKCSLQADAIRLDSKINKLLNVYSEDLTFVNQGENDENSKVVVLKKSERENNLLKTVKDCFKVLETHGVDRVLTNHIRKKISENEFK